MIDTHKDKTKDDLKPDSAAGFKHLMNCRHRLGFASIIERRNSGQSYESNIRTTVWHLQDLDRQAPIVNDCHYVCQATVLRCSILRLHLNGHMQHRRSAAVYSFVLCK